MLCIISFISVLILKLKYVCILITLQVARLFQVILQLCLYSLASQCLYMCVAIFKVNCYNVDFFQYKNVKLCNADITFSLFTLVYHGKAVTYTFFLFFK